MITADCKMKRTIPKVQFFLINTKKYSHALRTCWIKRKILSYTLLISRYVSVPSKLGNRQFDSQVPSGIAEMPSFLPASSLKTARNKWRLAELLEYSVGCTKNYLDLHWVKYVSHCHTTKVEQLELSWAQVLGSAPSGRRHTTFDYNLMNG